MASEMKTLSLIVLLGWAGVAVAAPKTSGPLLAQNALSEIAANGQQAQALANLGALSTSENGSGVTVIPNGASTPESITLAQLSAQSGVLLDTFKQAGDPDDTSSLTRAVAAGVPILLGPHKYIVNNFDTGVVANLVMRGIPDQSVIERTTGTPCCAFFEDKATNTYISGVTFNMNSASVTGNQYGVLLPQGGQNVEIKDSTFENNGGSLGECLTLEGTGPAAGGWFNITDNNLTNCSLNALSLVSVSNGIVSRNYIHDTTTNGIFIGANGTPSSTNYASNITVDSNILARNSTGIGVGGYSQPYSNTMWNTPSATNILIHNDQIFDNTSEGIGIESDYVSAIGNHIYQTTSSADPVAAIDSLSRYAVVEDNSIQMLRANAGIDMGGSISATVKNNSISMTSSGGNAAINSGGNTNSVFEGNNITLAGTDATGIYNNNIESASGSFGATFPTLSSNDIFEDNTIKMLSSTSDSGILIKDNSGGGIGESPLIVKNNHFIMASGVEPQLAQALTFSGTARSVQISGNDVNGSDCTTPAIYGNNIVYDNVAYGGCINQPSALSSISGIIPFNLYQYGLSGVIYVYPLTGGSGYTAATTLTATPSGSGSGWAGSPLIVGGSIVGVVTTSRGSGYSRSTVTVTATDGGGGTGATFAVGQSYTIPQTAIVTLNADSTEVLQTGSSYTPISSSEYMNLLSGSSITLRQAGPLQWTVQSYNLPTIAVGSLPMCSSTNNTSKFYVSGSVTGKWLARCNGTNWIWPDGTTVTD